MSHVMFPPIYIFCWIKTFAIFWFSIQNSQFEINFVSKISFVDAFFCIRILFMYNFKYQKFIFFTKYTAAPPHFQSSKNFKSMILILSFGTFSILEIRSKISQYGSTDLGQAGSWIPCCNLLS